MTVLAVDERAVTVRTSQGHDVTLAGEGIDTEHLDYGYALTVHRAQGATYDRTHVLAAGGGRELAYVALSRARDRTAIYATADDLDQAIGDIQADWGVERVQRWITDTSARRGREHEGAARIEATQNEIDGLRQGAERWQGTDLTASRDWREPSPPTRWKSNAARRDRGSARRAMPGHEAALEAAVHDWDGIGQPAAIELDPGIEGEWHELLAERIAAMTHRLDVMQHGAVERTPERDLGIGL
jgi:hypothetical protein